MKIWIDICHTPQYNFYRNLILRLVSEGHEVFITVLRRGKTPVIVRRELAALLNEDENQNENDNLCLLRQSGDIDIYLEGGFEKVNAFVQRTCPTKEINELEIHYHCLPDTEVEIHYRPFIMRNPFKNRKLQRFFAEEGEKCFENKIALPNGVGEIAVPTTTFNLVHQMVHIYHHMFTEGIGLRQLLDYYFLLRSVKCIENVKDSKECIHSLGLDRVASALMWVIKTVFVGHDNDDETITFFLGGLVRRTEGCCSKRY